MKSKPKLAEPSNPPTSMVEWKATHKDGTEVVVWAMRWYDARKEACEKMGAEAADVKVEQMK